MDLLTIGAFARLTHLSSKALRIYARLGLLTPAHVDPDTGYRWYAPDQLATARQVALLRQLDMPLNRITEIIALPSEEASLALAAYWAEREQVMTAQRELVGYLVNNLNGKRSVMYEVLLRDVPARTLLTTSEHLTTEGLSEFATPLFTRYGGPEVPKPDGEAGRPFLRYLGDVSADSDGPVEFCCPVEDEAAGQFPELSPVREPAGREAYIRVEKSAITTLLGFETLRQWFIGQNREPAGAPRQIFLADPAAVGPEDVVYELAVPVR
jgi:DNA-binding transcriptional MerR regulator